MKILLPVDGSELSLDAVRHAIHLVESGLEASFVLLNVQEPTSLYEMVVAPDVKALDRIASEAGIHAMGAAEDLLRQADIAVEREVVSGDPAHLIVEAAERHQCGAIIIGARGHGAIRSALFGSVSQSVMGDAPIPVTIVKHGPEAEEAVPPEL